MNIQYNYVKNKEEIIDKLNNDDKYFTSSLMSNKEFRKLIADIIIAESKAPAVYKGSVAIGCTGKEKDKSACSSLSSLKDEQTVDIINCNLIKLKRSKNPAIQCRYKYVEKYFKANLPEKNMINIYYIGDAHDDEIKKGEITTSVHWNCFIVDSIKQKIIVYDPALSIDMEKKETYDFNSEKLKVVTEELKKITGYPVYRILFDCAQQVFCSFKFNRESADIFCQTWVMLFSSIYLLDLVDNFAKIDFCTHQLVPLKMWLRCLFEHYKSILTPEEYLKNYDFFEKYISLTIDDYKYEIIRTPPIENCGQEKPVAFSVVKNFSNPKSKSTYELIPL